MLCLYDFAISTGQIESDDMWKSPSEPSERKFTKGIEHQFSLCYNMDIKWWQHYNKEGLTRKEQRCDGKQSVFIAIDLKSFYASVECRERGRDPLSTNLVVADKSRTEKTICLAVSPSLKSFGIPGRARLFEVVQKFGKVNARRQLLCTRTPVRREIGWYYKTEWLTHRWSWIILLLCRRWLYIWINSARIYNV